MVMDVSMPEAAPAYQLGDAEGNITAAEVNAGEMAYNRSKLDDVSAGPCARTPNPPRPQSAPADHTTHTTTHR